MKCNVLYFVLLISCWGCTSNMASGNRDQEDFAKNHGDNTFSIDLDQLDKVSALDIFDSVKIISLATLKESLISEIDGVIRDHNMYYILDQRQMAIFVFNLQGEFLRKIQRVGKGPGEYAYLSDFQINRFTGNLELLSPWGQVFVYDSLGTFVEAYRLPSSVRAVHYFVHLNRDTIAFYSKSEEDRLVIYSRGENRIIKQDHKIPVWIFGNTFLNNSFSPFSIYNDTVRLHEVFSNKAYYFDGCDLRVRYAWDFGKHNFSLTYLPLDQAKSFYSNFLKNSSYAYYLFSNIETSRYLYTQFFYKGKALTLLFDKKTKKHLLFDRFTEGIELNVLNSFGDAYYSIIDYENMNLLLTPDVLGIDGKKLLKNLNEESNPIIIEYYIKGHE